MNAVRPDQAVVVLGSGLAAVDVVLSLAEQGSGQQIELHAGWVINCTGPLPSNSLESNPVIGSLLVDGWLCLYELALGVETTAAGNAIAAERRGIPDLFVVGTLRKPSFWESTTVPELREQAATVAERVYWHGLRTQAPISTREEPSIRHPAAARYERQSATSSAFPVYRRPAQLRKVLQSRVLQHRISILWTMSTGGT